MLKPERKLKKSIIIRMNEAEKKELNQFLRKNQITLQDLLRGYIQNLITDNNTPTYEAS
jgi:hypothetical protein